jgi:hypothetical protein
VKNQRFAFVRFHSQHFADKKLVIAHAIVIHFATEKMCDRIGDQRRLVRRLQQCDAVKTIRGATRKLSCNVFLRRRKYAHAKMIGVNERTMQSGIDAQTPLHEWRFERNGAERIGRHTERRAVLVERGDNGDTRGEAREGRAQRGAVDSAMG